MTSRSKITKYTHSENGKNIAIPYLYRDEFTGIFYFRKNGKKTKSLETDNFKVAKLRLAEALAIAKDKSVSPKSQKIFIDYFNEMRDERKTQGNRESTMIAINSVGEKAILPFWKNFAPSDIHPGLITEYIKWHNRKRAGLQMVNPFKYIGATLNHMERIGAINKSQMPAVKLPKGEQIHHEEQKGTYVTRDEFNSIRAKCDNRVGLIAEIAYLFGMRIGEITRLDLKRIDFDKRVINLSAYEVKTGYGRSIPLTDELVTLIKKQIKFGSKVLFPMKRNHTKPMATQNVDRDFRKAVKLAGVKRRINFHSLRHTAATNFAKANINPSVACTILGMSIRTYQKRYLKLQADDLRSAIEAVSAKPVKAGRK